ncbi:phospholipase A1 [Condylostylus longicornis]|uniref:phospholipase A1 n=1 Tax=Condylostylus longicornis TaxID=2530218 RepID=UPI00244DCCF5|nr:phospholipase A1 [Condylostylus longicornis]
MKCRYLFFIFFMVFIAKVSDVSAVFGRNFQQFIRSGVWDVNILRCVIKGAGACPHPDVNFRIYSPKGYKKGLPLDVRNPFSLYASGFSKYRETAILIHGFNGTEQDEHFRYLRDAYLSRDFNVVTVDWRPLTQYPCYLTALANTRLTAQCAAQVYAFLTHNGAIKKKITCVGHSLGAHICGMMTNHLTSKQYRIIGLDPARPLIESKKSFAFRLTRDDAVVTQVIHTNAGYLGQEESVGQLNFCVNGGRYQPYCKGHPIRRSRCSHFLSICYLANSLFKHKSFVGVPCPDGCKAITGPHKLPLSNYINPFDVPYTLKNFKIGTDAPDDATGIYCIDTGFVKHCPFNDR